MFRSIAKIRQMNSIYKNYLKSMGLWKNKATNKNMQNIVKKIFLTNGLGSR